MVAEGTGAPLDAGLEPAAVPALAVLGAPAPEDVLLDAPAPEDVVLGAALLDALGLAGADPFEDEDEPPALMVGIGVALAAGP